MRTSRADPSRGNGAPLCARGWAARADQAGGDPSTVLRTMHHSSSSCWSLQGPKAERRQAYQQAGTVADRTVRTAYWWGLLRHLLPEHPVSLPGKLRSQGGGGGRVQAERQTRQDPQGQGYGPEGERTVERTRSPGPGRWCPCGCPRQVVQLSRLPGEPSGPTGWFPTIMTHLSRRRPHPTGLHADLASAAGAVADARAIAGCSTVDGGPAFRRRRDGSHAERLRAGRCPPE